jgi:hypothetical protein
MKNPLLFGSLIAVFLATTARHPGAVPTTTTVFHNCSMVGESSNTPHLFDISKIYKCDEGAVEIAGRREMTIENGYVYETEMGEPNSMVLPHLAIRADYRDYKWCSKPGPTDPNQKVMCGDKPTTCYDGKLATWNPDWQGYSCVTPDHH